MSGSRRRWLVLAVATALLTTGVMAVRVASDHRRAPAELSGSSAVVGCAEVLFVGADGGGERPSGTTTFGPSVQGLYSAISAYAAGSGWTMAARRVPFPSQLLAAIKRAPDATGYSTSVVTGASVIRWRSGVGTAMTATNRLLAEAAAACPQQQLVLAGYSQGAVVMHRVALALPSAVRARLTGLVLIGDGDRAAQTRATYLRGSPAAGRAATGVVWKLRARAADVPAAGWTLPVWSVCTSGDLVCDFRRTRFAPAAATHRSYRSGQASAGAVAKVAFSVWWRIKHHPIPAVTPLPLTFHVGEPVRFRVPVKIAPVAATYVRATLTSKLPPGLLMTRRGLVTGTPVTTGDWQVRYTLHSAESAEYARRVPGRLDVTVLPSATESLTGGGRHSCIIRQNRQMWCTGANSRGQLGTGTTTASREPVLVRGGVAWGTATAGGESTCGISVGGSLYCWGLNHKGQLGLQDRTTRLSPTRVGTATDWATVSTSWYHTCATKRSGTLWCWGFNANGQVGDGTRTTRARPVRVGALADWTTVTVGGFHTCATRAAGTVWCWGHNDFGQLGDGTFAGRLTPVQTTGLSDAVRLGASWGGTCAVRTSGAAACWGRNYWGQVGDGSVGPARTTPTSVAGESTWSQIAVGDAFTCALDSGGAVWCWGGSRYGQLGIGSRSRRLQPVQVTLPAQAVWLSAGWAHACAALEDGQSMCWGLNDAGQLGDGTLIDATKPSPTR